LEKCPFTCEDTHFNILAAKSCDAGRKGKTRVGGGIVKN